MTVIVVSCVLAVLFLIAARLVHGTRGFRLSLGMFAVVAVLVAVDQLTKLWAVRVLQNVDSIPFIPGILEFRFTLNDGAAFSMLGGKQTFLILFTSLALLVLTVYLVFRMPVSRLEYAAWTLVLAGGIGNLIDRVANGAVVDFWNVLFMNFAIFNFADVLVTVGVCLLILYLIQVELREHRRKADGDGYAAA